MDWMQMVKITHAHTTASSFCIGMCWCGEVVFFRQFSAAAKSGIIAELQRFDPLHLMSAR